MNSTKDCVPIISGNVTYAGLTIPEIALNFIIFSGYSIFTGFSKGIILPLILQLIFNVLYVQFFSKLEENFIYVIISYFNIPNVIWGFSNLLPVRKFRNDNSSSTAPFGNRCRIDQ